MTEGLSGPYPEEFSRLVGIIQELGYRAVPIDAEGEPATLQTGIGGYTVILFYYPGHSVQMFTGFRRKDDIEFGIEQANEFNAENRFAKCYVSSESLRFEGDFLFDLNRESAVEDLKGIFGSWEISLGYISEALSKAEQGANSDASEAGSSGNSAKEVAAP